MVVREVDFLTGRFVPVKPGKRPEYKVKQPDQFSIAGEEYHRGFWRRFGELDGEEAYKDQKKRDNLRGLIEAYRLQQMSNLLSER